MSGYGPRKLQFCFCFFFFLHVNQISHVTDVKILNNVPRGACGLSYCTCITHLSYAEQQWNDCFKKYFYFLDYQLKVFLSVRFCHMICIEEEPTFIPTDFAVFAG